MYKHILVPTDGSALSLKAAKAAAALAKKLGAKITAMHVIPPFYPPVSPDGAVFHFTYGRADYERDARKAAAKATAKVEKIAAGVRCEHYHPIDAKPWQAVIAAAKAKKCDLIVMASHGRRGLEGVLLGSETQKVLTHSKVPVLVCR